MRPKKHKTTGSNDLFRARLDQIINMKHELVRLAGKVDWDWIDGEIAPLYSENGRPGIETRFMIGLLLLKHIYGLSDEGVCERWVHDPYFQYFTGEEFFQHAFPHERSDLSHWRKRLGDRLELLLAESLRVAHEAGALRGQDLKRVTVDTTVQPKAITFPTDAKLLHAAIKGLNRLARRHGVRLRQSYSRLAKTAAMMAGRYAHAKQFRRHQRQLRILRSRLGDHPRHPPQDRGPASAGGGVRPPAGPGHADPLATAAPARLEALFFPCPGGGVHRQRQGRRALRVRRKGLHRHQQPPGSRGPVRAARQGDAR
jgi:IS5 family transposase